jgi:ubiquinone/menaquinone biosynthesis C-methylase UbiE
MEGDHLVQQAVNPTSRRVGLRDIAQLGWCNTKTSELVPGIVISSGMTVVDIGCGNGGYIEFCAVNGADITFIDRQEDHVRTLESKISQLAGVVYRGIVSDCDPVPLPDAHADVVICTEVLEHVVDPDRLMREIARIGKAGATFFVTVPDSRGENLMKEVADPSCFKEPNHIHIFTSGDFEELIQRSGLKIIRHDYQGAFWAIFFLLKWATAEPGESLADDVHPITTLWTTTWAKVLDHPDSEKIVQALNLALPKSQTIIARKSAHANIGQD